MRNHAIGATDHAQRPENEVVDQQPGLLAEARQVLALRDAPTLGQRSQHVFHGRGAQAGEEDDAEGEKAGIAEAGAIQARLGVLVGEGEELDRVGLRLGDAEVGEEEEGEKVEGET